MNKLIAIIFLSIIFLSGVNAITFQQGENISIRHSVRFNDGITNTASCNITLVDPDGKLIYNFRPTFFDSASQTYNITIYSNSSTESGNYCYDLTCSDRGFNKTLSNCVELTASGKEFETSEAIVYIFIILVAISIFVFCIYGISSINGGNFYSLDTGYMVKINFGKHIKYFLIIVAYITFLWVNYLAWNVSVGYLHIATATAFFAFIWRTMLALLLPIVIVYIILGVILFIRDLNLQQKIKGGLQVTING